MRATGPSDGRRRRKVAKALKLALLALLGLCTVSIPVTVALVLSASGTSDLITIGGVATERQHQTPAEAVARQRCVASRGYYALTFDDGPIADTTPRLVVRLRRAKAVATFFDIGERAAAHPDLVELQRSVGQVANHSYSHAHMPELSHARRLQELQTTARVLDYPNALFRPPYGETSPVTDADIRRTGLIAVYWTLDVRDARASAAAIAKRALRVEPGGIILLHDGGAGAIAAVPDIVAALRRRGLCPGFIAPTATVVESATGIPFHAIAVKP
jgi:peptidoglycan/xylan/chitin deacetylase (PgdA/CDA1 family)